MRDHLTALGPAAAGHRRLDPRHVAPATGSRCSPGWPGGAPSAEDRQAIYDALLAAARRAAQRSKPPTPQRASTSVLEGMRPGQELQGPPGGRPGERPGGAGRDRRPARAQRRGKDHDLLPYYGADPARTRAGCGSTGSTSPARRCTSGPAPGIGYLAQEPSIFRKMTVEENILAILETRRPRAGTSGTASWTACSTSCRSSTCGRAGPTA